MREASREIDKKIEAQVRAERVHMWRERIEVRPGTRGGAAGGAGQGGMK